MSITTANVITRARQLLADNNAESSYTDTILLASVNAAQRRLKNDRPDLRLSSAGAMTAWAASTVVTDVLIWNDDQLEALALETASNRLLDDSYDEANRAQSAELHAKYLAEIS